MRQQFSVRRLGAALAVTTLTILASLGIASAANAAPAAAAHTPTTVARAKSMPTAVHANVVRPAFIPCDLPTQADIGSYFLMSYTRCGDCINEANHLNWISTGIPDYWYYCTYNPSDTLTDLHYDYYP